MWSYFGERVRWVLAIDLVDLRKLSESRRGGHHRARVFDRCLDLGAVSDDRGIVDKPVDVARSHSGDLGDVEDVKHLLERFPLAEHDLPAQPGLEHAES